MSGRDHGASARSGVRLVEHPTLGETNGNYGRFSGTNMFALYRELKDRTDGKGAFAAEEAAKKQRVAMWMRRAREAFTLRDFQMSQAAATLMKSVKPGSGLLSWTKINSLPPAEFGLEPYRDSLTDTAATVKAAARYYGAGLVGIASLKESYINRREQSREGEKEHWRDIVIADVDVPEYREDKCVIPKKMKWAVAIAIPMDLDLMEQAPTALGDAATYLGYSESYFVVGLLAEFIRGLGYEAIPCVNDTAQSVPIAIDAGLGELGRMNKLITPEYGPAVRLCKVLTDLPMEIDKPIDAGIVSFCKHCRQCANACPGRALSFDEEPSFATRGPWNNPGHKAWFEDSYRCYSNWQRTATGCGVCIATCPHTRAAHERLKLTTSTNAATPRPWWKSKGE